MPAKDTSLLVHDQHVKHLSEHRAPQIGQRFIRMEIVCHLSNCLDMISIGSVVMKICVLVSLCQIGLVAEALNVFSHEKPI